MYISKLNITKSLYEINILINTSRDINDLESLVFIYLFSDKIRYIGLW